MEVFIFDWQWTSHQSRVQKDLGILRFEILLWKDERESIIKLCKEKKLIDVIQKLIRIQNFGQNWWWINGNRVEYLPSIHHIAALSQSPKVTARLSVTSEKFTGLVIFMSMFNDISWGSKNKKKEHESNTQLVSLKAKMNISRSWR